MISSKRKGKKWNVMYVKVRDGKHAGCAEVVVKVLFPARAAKLAGEPENSGVHAYWSRRTMKSLGMTLCILRAD